MSDRPDMVPAWHLTEGDELPGRVTVISVQREAVGRTERVVTDEPAVAEPPADSPVPVIRQAR